MAQIHLTFVLIIFFFLQTVTAQDKQRVVSTFGKPSQFEISMKNYPEAPLAAGVVLFEKGTYFTEMINGSLKLVKEVYVKTKVIDAKRFDQTEVFIPMQRNGNSGEKITKLKAITHNGINQTYVPSDAVYETDINQYWKRKQFAFPNVQDGSILEYTYRIESPYFFGLSGWVFQGSLPVLYSELETKIPGNFTYKRELVGSLPLDIKISTLLKNCLHIDGLLQSADCDHAIYAMFNIPAFKEESYMLASENYKASIKYELQKTIGFDGSRSIFSKTWKDVDNEFESDKNMGGQLNNKNFFKGKLPEEIIQIQDDLERAKAVYSFIQNYYTWNGNTRIFSDIRVRDAFSEGKGNSSEINISLINALKATNLDAKIMLLSTREYALPSRAYPILTDFNYAIAILKIGKQEYLLDATNKNAPFGILPFRLLNIFGRVMDFKNGSYWQNITPNAKNLQFVNVQLKAEENDVFRGSVQEVTTGYMALQERNQIDEETETKYFANKEKNNESLTIENGDIANRIKLDEPLKINYSVNITNEVIDNKIYLNPYFFETFFKENPFTLEHRSYPIDFGFPITTTYLIAIDLNEKYSVLALPENKSIKLADGALCTVVYSEADGNIQMRYNFKLNPYYKAEAYEFLKTFFESIIKIQTQDLIVLEKR